MSNYNSTATATIYVNGQPAQQTIAKLKDDVLGYRKSLQEIAADKSLGVNSKEWNEVRKKMVEAEKELGRVQSGVANVTQTSTDTMAYPTRNASKCCASMRTPSRCSA